MTDAHRHNSLAPDLLRQLVTGVRGEAQAMVVAESILLGLLLYYRPNDNRAQTLFLETITEGVIERLDA